jgi:hypothetical protein
VVFVVVMIPVIMVVFRVSGFFWGDLTMVDGGCLLVCVFVAGGVFPRASAGFSVVL